MSRSAISPRRLVVALCIAVLATQVVGTHLHLCFDGHEPPASVQLGHPGADDMDPDHQDQDVTVSGYVLIKSLDNAILLPALLGAAVLLFVLGIPRRLDFPPQFERAPIPASTGFRLRPPLRGPPR